jgi:hypothetical protein
MKIQYLTYIFILFLTAGCYQKTKDNSKISETEMYTNQVDSVIDKQSPYQYVNAFKRFGTYMFGLDTNLTLNKDYPYTMLTSNYDTVTRKLTSIGIFYFKDKKSTYLNSDEINFDDSQRIVKVRVINDELSVQRQAYYYFRSDSLLYKNTHNIEIANLEEYLTKIDSIKKKVTKELIKNGLINP